MGLRFFFEHLQNTSLSQPGHGALQRRHRPVLLLTVFPVVKHWDPTRPTISPAAHSGMRLIPVGYSISAEVKKHQT
jgi:hypothetical protein